MGEEVLAMLGIRARRTAFASAICVVLAIAMAGEADDLSPLELMEMGENGPSMPLRVVNAMATKMQDENARLKAENAALRTSEAVNKAKQKILIAGGVVKKKKKAEKTKKKKGIPRIPAKKELSPVIAKGLGVMSKIDKENQKLKAKLAQDTVKIDAAKQAKLKKKILRTKKKVKAKAIKKQLAKPAKYNRIPFFQFTAASKTAVGIKNRKECQMVCDKQIKCKSFSYSRQKKDCLWSVDAVHYDPHDTFGVKASLATPGEPLAKWRRFPGVKFLTASSKQKNNVLRADCENTCAKDAGCKSYSWKVIRGETNGKGWCTWGATGVSYKKSYNYYEKVVMGEMAMKQQEKQRTAKLKSKMFAMEVASKKKEAGDRAKLAAEGKAKNRAKEGWTKNMPTPRQEKKMKMKVQRQVSAMNVQLAAKKAAKAAKKEKKEEKVMDKDRLAAYAKVTKMESALRKVKAAEVKENRIVAPLALKVTSTKVAMEKATTKSKLNDIDFTTSQQSMKAAEAAVELAKKNKDDAAAKTATVTVDVARKKLKEKVKLRDSLKSQIAKLKGELGSHTSKLKAAQAKQAIAQAATKTKELAMKESVKKLKTVLKKAGLRLYSEKEKAWAAKMLTAKSKERLAKIVVAKMKVEHWEATQEIKHVSNDAERKKAQARLAHTEGALFEAKKKNTDVVNVMKKTAHSLARYKEGLNKSKKKVKKAVKVNVKAKVARKIAEVLDSKVTMATTSKAPPPPPKAKKKPPSPPP